MGPPPPPKRGQEVYSVHFWCISVHSVHLVYFEANIPAGPYGHAGFPFANRSLYAASCKSQRVGMIPVSGAVTWRSGGERALLCYQATSCVSREEARRAGSPQVKLVTFFFAFCLLAPPDAPFG